MDVSNFIAGFLNQNKQATYIAGQGQQTATAEEGEATDLTLIERVWEAAKANRDKTASGNHATATTTPGIMWNQTPTPTQPPEWTTDEAARFLAMVARTDDLTGNCC